MAKEINYIDITEYYCIKPEVILHKTQSCNMIDIVLEKDHTFYVYNNGHYMLSHNCDGHHITGLIINFFQRWLPHIIDNKKLFILATPLVSCKYNGESKYFYDLDEFNDFNKNNKLTSINYLKGLGSLSVDDWKYVMSNKLLWQVTKDCQSDKYIEIAFGNDSKKKRKWLES